MTKENWNFRGKKVKAGNGVFVFCHETEDSEGLDADCCSCFCHTPRDRCPITSLELSHHGISVREFVQLSILANMSNAYEKRLKGI